MNKTRNALVILTLGTATFFFGSSLASTQERRDASNQGNQNNSGQNRNSNRGTNSNAGRPGNMDGMTNRGTMTNTDTGASMTMTTADANALDREFAVVAAMGGQAEIQMSQLALQRSTNRDVQKFAQRMIKDHTKNARDLQKVAARKQITLPTTLSPEMTQMMTQLQQASGAEFDRLYIQMGGVTAHTMMRQLYSNQASNGTDEDLKKYARKTLPVVEMHLRMAQQMNAGGSAAMNH